MHHFTQSSANLREDENSNLSTDSQYIWNMWRKYFCQLLNVQGVNDIRQTEIHIDERLLSKPSSFEVETAIEKLKLYETRGTDQSPEVIQEECDAQPHIFKFSYHQSSGRNLLLYLLIERIKNSLQ
jgi:hypothetical protein